MEKSSNYADHILSTIIDYHFKQIEDKDIASFKNVSFTAPQEDDTGIILLAKLFEQGSLHECRALLSTKNNEVFRISLSSFMDAASVDNYINLLEQSLKKEDNNNKDILTWLATAWGLDSAIVQKQFHNYYETTI